MNIKHILKLTLIAVSSFVSGEAAAQGMAVNATGTAAVPSAMLDVSSTTQGMLIPRMDSTHRATISTPATGLMVYQTNGLTPGFYFYNGTAWTSLTAQTNTFNGNSQLVQLDATGKLPAIDGSALTNLPSSGGGSGSIGTLQYSGTATIANTVQNGGAYMANLSTITNNVGSQMNTTTGTFSAPVGGGTYFIVFNGYGSGGNNTQIVYTETGGTKTAAHTSSINTTFYSTLLVSFTDIVTLSGGQTLRYNTTQNSSTGQTLNVTTFQIYKL